jgi:hypothetical protein
MSGSERLLAPVLPPLLTYRSPVDEGPSQITADGHESLRSLSRKNTLKTIAVSPVVASLLEEDSEEAVKRTKPKSSGLTADGLASSNPSSVLQRKPSNAGQSASESRSKSKFKSAAHAVAISTGEETVPPPLTLLRSPSADKKRTSSQFRH